MNLHFVKNQNNFLIAAFDFETWLPYTCLHVYDTRTFGMKISHQKTKIMAFKGTEPVRSKIVIDNMILEQVNTFTYLGCNISYQEDKDIHSKITKFLQTP
jgi:hypothetical protein